jgi:hypothetical protein
MPLGQVLLDTALCDKVCQRLAAGQWFSSSTPVSSTNKNYRHNITEILLKVAQHHNPNPTPYKHLPLENPILDTSTAISPGFLGLDDSAYQ